MVHEIPVFLQADGKEGIYIAELNVEQLRLYRKRKYMAMPIAIQKYMVL